MLIKLLNFGPAVAHDKLAALRDSGDAQILPGDSKPTQTAARFATLDLTGIQSLLSMRRQCALASILTGEESPAMLCLCLFDAVC